MAYKTIPNEVIENIVNKTDIYSIISNFMVLSKKGNDYIGLCPFHADSTPSLSVSPQKNIFKCFSCGVGGDAISFVKRIKNISYVETLEYLANQIGLEFDFQNFKGAFKESYSEDQLESLEALNLANSQYKLEVFDNDLAFEYLTKRGLSVELREHFNVGFSPKKGISDELINKLGFDYKNLINSGIMNTNFNEIITNRVTFGIENHQGRIVAFSGRSIDNQTPKYINSPTTEFFNKSNILYNYAKAKEAIDLKKEVIITEGFMDVIALYRSDIKNAVCLMGTSFTKNHVKYLKNLSVILFLDNDTAGVNATKKTIKFLLENRITAKVVVNDINKDPDEIFNSYGPNKLVELINSSIPVIDFIYKILQKTYQMGGDITSDKSNSFINEFSEYLAFENKDTQDFFVAKIKSKYFIDISHNLSNYSKNNDNFEVEYNQQIDPVFSNFVPVLPKNINNLHKKRQNHEADLMLNTLVKYILENRGFVKYYSEKAIKFSTLDKRNFYQVSFASELVDLYKKYADNQEIFRKIISNYKKIFISCLVENIITKDDYQNYMNNLKNNGIISQCDLNHSIDKELFLKELNLENKNANKLYEQIIIIKTEITSEKQFELLLSNLKKVFRKLTSLLREPQKSKVSYINSIDSHLFKANKQSVKNSISQNSKSKK